MLISLMIPCYAFANYPWYEFRDCANEADAHHPDKCLKKCQAFGLSVSSFEINPAQTQVTETVWVAGKKTGTLVFTDCAITNRDDWRCQSESTMMGGVVRKEIYSKSGFLYLNVSGSGGQQYLCTSRVLK